VSAEAVPRERLVEGRVAVVYGGGGALGGAVARELAREGARVFLAGRTLAPLQAAAAEITAAGGEAEVDTVDALDGAALERHADSVAARAGRIDVALNAIGVSHVQGVPLAELSEEDFFHPVDVYLRSNFLTSKAVARHMTGRGSGVILVLNPPGARLTSAGFLGHGAACAAVEAFSRLLACELGPSGVRVVCIRSHAVPEALAAGSYTNELFTKLANGAPLDDFMAKMAGGTLLRRLPTLEQLAGTAAFLASDRAGAMTGTVANLTSGFAVD